MSSAMPPKQTLLGISWEVTETPNVRLFHSPGGSHQRNAAIRVPATNKFDIRSHNPSDLSVWILNQR